MRIAFFTCSLLLSILFLSAQQEVKIHTPAEIIKMVSDSKIAYEINQLQSKIEPDYAEKLNYNDVYRRYDKDGFSTAKYKPTDAALEANHKAEEAFQGHNISEARKYYREAYEKDSSFYMVMTYIGQTYGLEKNPEKAIEWYQKAIQKNYIDYMAHWFLADAYDDAGRLEEAKKEILIAHILNRNNPRILTSLKIILSKNGINYENWYFSPQYKLDKSPDNKISIEYEGNWLIYALTKALWVYEPGYAESMGKKDNTLFNEYEEKEALAGMLMQADKKKSEIPEIRILKKALDKKMVQEYIFYEILLPQYPVAAYQFPEVMVNSIADYLLHIRCSK